MHVTVSDCRHDGSDAAPAAEWDRFLATSPGGHHVQTSLWGQLKATLGWQAVRIVARADARIIGGLQLLVRPIRVLGAVGYVPNGPLIAPEDEDVARVLIDELLAVVRQQRIRFLVLQPPSNGHWLERCLQERQFCRSSVSAFPMRTTRLNLERPLDDILSGMKPKTRYNIRLAERRGVTVREGSRDDLPVFHQMLMLTARRQRFTDYSLHYFTAMHSLFSERAQFKLFLAEYRGEVVSSLLVIPVCDTALFKKGAWSGRHGNLHPNESAHWHAIQWAKAHGYRYYDFEAIDAEPSTQLSSRQSFHADAVSSVARFKLGFGGDVVVHPPAFELAANPVVRWMRRVTNQRQFTLKTLVDRLKTSPRW